MVNCEFQQCRRMKQEIFEYRIRKFTIFNVFHGSSFQMFEEDGLPAHICNKCVVHVSKAFAFKQQCVKSDEELRKEQLALIQHQDEDVVYMKSDAQTGVLPADETIPDDDGYTYHLVEEYEDEERIDDDDGVEFGDDKNVQIVLKVERRDGVTGNDGNVEQYNIEMSEVEEPSPSMNETDHGETVQEEVFEYEVENDESSQTGKGESDDEELDVIPKMVE